MPIALDVNDPEYWDQRAKEARRLAERMGDETAKQTMLVVAQVCDRFAIGAAMCSIYELAISHVIDRTRGADAPMMPDPPFRFRRSCIRSSSVGGGRERSRQLGMGVKRQASSETRPTKHSKEMALGALDGLRMLANAGFGDRAKEMQDARTAPVLKKSGRQA